MEAYIQKSSANSTIVTGYFFTLLSLLILPVIFMPAAIICGIINMGNNSNPTKGLILALLAVLIGCFAAHIGGWGLGLPKFNL